jgi:DNA-binding response OmpR family regulator
MSSFGNTTNLQWYKIIAEKDEEISKLREENLFLRETLKFDKHENNIPCLNLTKQERLTLNILLENPDCLVTYKHITNAWNVNTDRHTDKIKVVIFKIRKKIKVYDLYIQTVYGEGFIVTKDTVHKYNMLTKIHANCSTNQCMAQHE